MATQPAVWNREVKQAPVFRRRVPDFRPDTRYQKPGTPRWSRSGERSGRHAAAAGVGAAPERQNLLISLFPLVKRLALKMRAHLPSSVEVDDLVGAGALGLLDAVDKFDSSKRTQLETYARHRIRGSMLDSLRALDPAPRSLRAQSRKIEKLHRDLENRLGRVVSDEEMVEALGVDLKEWYRILQKLRSVVRDGDLGGRACPSNAGRRPARTGTGAGADGDGTADLPQPADGAGPFELLLRREQREILGRALAGLPVRDQAVMTLYYQHELTMQQIAARLGVDESRISQIHSQAVARLKRHVQTLLSPPEAAHALPCGATDFSFLPSDL